MTRKVTAFLLAALLSGPAMAGTVEGTQAYERGDYAAAHREFSESAKAGDARAQFSLGLMYLRGQGVPPDLMASLRWLRKAAGRGDGDARLALGEIHLREAPPVRDYVKSYMWLTLALARVRGIKRTAALEMRTQAAAKMTDDQVKKAKALADQWKALEK
jgi:hypothetical protein